MKANDSKKETKARRSKPYSEWTKEAYDSFRDYQIKYYKENYRTFAIKFSRDKDSDIIEYLESQENIANWVREKARKDIDRLNRKKEKDSKK